MIGDRERLAKAGLLTLPGLVPPRPCNFLGKSLVLCDVDIVDIGDFYCRETPAKLQKD